MKKTIFKNLFVDVTIFFILCSFTLTLITWILQAVNFLDIVSEDGHSLKVYFAYSSLNIPKIYSKLLLLSFFISLFYVLSTYENKNQLLIFWINGITKKEFINKILSLTILYLLISYLLSYFIVPYTQNKARSFIRQSNLDFFPSLIKPKKFIDTVENLTIFLDEKNNNSLERILIKEDGNFNSQLIISKKGVVLDNNLNKYLKLENGIIIQDLTKKDLQSFSFEVTNFDLNRFKTKTTVTPKIQETSSKKIISCLKNLENNNFISNVAEGEFNCQKSLKKKLIEELYKRILLPFFIPLLGIISSFVILKSNNSFNYNYFKIKVFFTGITIIILSQLINNLVSKNFYSLIFSISFPFILIIISYFIYNKKIN